MNKFSKFTAEVICELHPLFKGLLWVSAARSTDETRAALMNVLIEREDKLCHIVATDGRRLHLHTFDPGMFDTDIDMLEPGQYEVITKNAKLIIIAPTTEDYNYPNWRAVMPDHEPQHSAVITSQTISKLGIMTGVLLAADFVNDAIGFKHGVSKDASVLIDFGSARPKEAFVITHDLGKAIVMPLRIDEKATEDEAKNDVEMTGPLPGFERSPLSVPGESLEISTNDTGIKIEDGKITTITPKQAADEAMGYDTKSPEYLLLEKLNGMLHAKDKAKRERAMNAFILKHDENVFLKAWTCGKKTGFHKDVMEEIAGICREIDPTGDFIP